MNTVCNFFGHTRQAFYKRQQGAIKTFIQEQQIIAEVHRIRSKQPKVGGRKLLKDIQNLGFNVGRDRLFDILRKHHMLVKRKKYGPRTTYSNHWLQKHTNLVKGVQLTGPNQVFVSDITYLRVSGSFAYLSLVTDAWSRKIVGWDISSSLCVKGAIRALKMALKNVPQPEGLIHHSDRCIQYCCKEYFRVLNNHHVFVSMTEENHCYENAIAERVNGILKDEFCLNQSLSSLKIAKELVRESIHIYNHYRRHMSLDYEIPAVMHDEVTL